MTTAARAICSAKFPDLVAKGLIKFADGPPITDAQVRAAKSPLVQAYQEKRRVDAVTAYRAHLIVKMELKIAGIKATPDWWGNTRLSASVEAWEEALGMVRDQP